MGNCKLLFIIFYERIISIILLQNSTFGWDEKGMRGHVFGNNDNSLLIIGFKGTSGSIFNNEPTGEQDKFNV